MSLVPKIKDFSIKEKGIIFIIKNLNPKKGSWMGINVFLNDSNIQSAYYFTLNFP